MSNSEKNNDLFIRWIDGDLTQEELHQIKSDPEYQKYSAILNEVDQWKVPKLNKEEGYKRLVSRRTRTRTITWYQTNVFKMAAVFLLLAAALTWFFVLNGPDVTYETGIAETQEIKLPDGSVVHLGASSSLSYNKEVWERRRDLKLSGTGHFDVTHGTPFKVHFQQGTVEVLGTSFEIKSQKKFASVTCYDGRVSVQARDTTVVLTRGRGASVSHNKGWRIFDSQDDTWSPNITRFHSAPLSAVFKSMEMQFGIKIKAGDVDLTRTFTGSYTNGDVELALKMVCDPMNINYDNNENTVTLQ